MQRDSDINFYNAIASGDIDAARVAREAGADINALRRSGLAPLHLAIGLNDAEATRYLIEECEASFGPDGFGRRPTVIAAQSRVNEALSDYVLRSETRYQCG